MSATAITDPEVLEFIAKTESFYPPEANQASAEENRRLYDRMCEAFRVPRPEGLIVQDSRISDVSVRTYCSNQVKQRPFVLYLHGGGSVVGSLDSHDDVCAEIAAETDRRVIAVDYRLAPEFLYPAQIDDVTAVWCDLVAKWGPGIVVGDSAGGTLCAALCLRTTRLGAPSPIAQILIYPWLGGDVSMDSYSENSEAPLLRTAEVENYIQVMTNGHLSLIKSEPELAPLATTKFNNFPPSLIITADVDPIRDDGVKFHNQLVDSGVDSILRNEQQLVHGFIRARHSCKRARESFAEVVKYILRN